MRILLLQLDGKLPNIALMRLAYHHRSRGDEVALRQCRTLASAERGLWDEWDLIYGSLIFSRSQPIARRLQEVFPAIRLGGTGWDEMLTLEHIGIMERRQDYSDYPAFRQSIGYTQRGCRLNCPFCRMRDREGPATDYQTIGELWRGEPWPREIALLDNDFFGAPSWRKRIDEMLSGRFKVSFSQGINARFLKDEEASAIASVDYRDDGMSNKRVYTAWDNREDEDTLFRGLDRLCKYGVRPDQIMVYMLIGYWRGETAEDRLYRQRRLREYGCRPYPMPYVRTPELVGFQRWVIGAYDKRVSWREWEAADYRPERLG